MLRRLALAALAALGALPSGAAEFNDPDWPCIQRKVLEITPGQVWSGPELPDPAVWQGDTALRSLAARLAVRRTELTEAETLITDFAAAAGEARAARLTALFAATFALLNAERGDIVGGIARYSHRQTELTAKIDALRDSQEALIATPNPSNEILDQIEELEDQIIWNTRIFTDRNQSLTYVCETPVILEQRAFSIAKAIQAHLD